MLYLLLPCLLSVDCNYNTRTKNKNVKRGVFFFFFFNFTFPQQEAEGAEAAGVPYNLAQCNLKKEQKASQA